MNVNIFDKSGKLINFESINSEWAKIGIDKL